ncbi:MAG: 4-hydroxythreonine-4-phosphate dehydrogenase PdxA [Oceanospirillaceae bacterium]|nr:4-hydroxythreonine-4-phosphate dehydrogenase PdxA [Oceanospirillaceae bacterium]
MKPRIAIILGDPSGIGPELIARLLSSEGVCDKADILLIADRSVIEAGQQVAGLNYQLQSVDVKLDNWQKSEGIAWHETFAIDSRLIETGKVTEACGQYVLSTLDTALDFAKDNIVDAIVFAPFNKAAMHLAGLKHSDELHYIAEYLGLEQYICELNTLDNIWTSRVTSHIALKDVPANINRQRICEAVELIDRNLRHSGLTQPRIAVAALNPHAGDNGNFGTEEIDIIAPAVESLINKGFKVDGPWPSDTVFLKLVAGEIDAVVTMYHDQGQIALKLLGFDRGVTVQGGIPFPITTPAHGTAFDIAGTGTADAGAMTAAFNLACDMSANWRS